jgi:hypothetical protein
LSGIHVALVSLIAKSHESKQEKKEIITGIVRSLSQQNINKNVWVFIAGEIEKSLENVFSRKEIIDLLQASGFACQKPLPKNFST